MITYLTQEMPPPPCSGHPRYAGWGYFTPEELARHRKAIERQTEEWKIRCQEWDYLHPSVQQDAVGTNPSANIQDIETARKVLLDSPEKECPTRQTNAALGRD